MDRKLVLENGIELKAKGFGSNKEVIAELVFNTSMVGYQEILSDPCYKGQIVVMTYPLIGNYGMIDEDYDSKLFGPEGMIVREYNDKPSNFRYTKTLNEVMEENEIPGLAHLDTRRLTRILRDEGSMLALICDAEVPHEEAMAKLAAYQAPEGLVRKVSCRKKWYSRCANPKYNVVAVDCGIQYSIIRELNRYGCNVTIVPCTTDMETVMSLNPDGILISNGPGNPEENTEVIELIRQLQGRKPMLGFGLGFQLIALANGLTTEKCRKGYHGGNIPVKNINTEKVDIVPLNYCYKVNSDGIDNSKAEVTHINLLDGTIAGLKVAEDCVTAIQFTPDALAAPRAAEEIYTSLVQQMENNKEGC